MSQSFSDTAKEVKEQAREVVNHPFVEPLMRLGYAVRGLLYALVGLLAIGVIWGGREGRFTDREGAIATLGAQPYGQFILMLVAIGLVGYALWGVVRAVYDPDRKGKGMKGLIDRFGYLVSAASYGALAFPTIRLLLRQPGGAGTNGSESEAGQRAAAGLMTTLLGPWIVGAAGLVMGAVGVGNILIGVRQDFDMRFKTYEMSDSHLRWALRLGRFGYIARGVVFVLIGVFLVQAALTENPGRVVGLDGALRELALQPYGLVLLGIVAAGLIAFGAFSILGSIWFRFKKS